MTGLEKMKSQILNEAELSAKKILDEAKQDAEKVMQTAKENAEAECGRISKKSEAELEAVKERAASSRDLQKRKAILQAKQEVIAKILDDVYEALLVLDDKSYFEFIRKMLKKFVLPQEGSICFSSNDLKRMPENFESEIRHQITADITAANKDELLGLQQEFESKRQELSDKKEEIEQIENQLKEEYEPVFGKDLLYKQRLNKFDSFCQENADLSLEEALTQYRALSGSKLLKSLINFISQIHHERKWDTLTVKWNGIVFAACDPGNRDFSHRGKRLCNTLARI